MVGCRVFKWSLFNFSLYFRVCSLFLVYLITFFLMKRKPHLLRHPNRFPAWANPISALSFFIQYQKWRESNRDGWSPVYLFHSHWLEYDFRSALGPISNHTRNRIVDVGTRFGCKFTKIIENGNTIKSKLLYFSFLAKKALTKQWNNIVFAFIPINEYVIV